jgi:D-cysteine desulfhydrase
MSHSSIIKKPSNPEKAVLQRFPHPAFISKQVTTEVLRLDLVDEVISGNKYFKLKYSVQRALDENKAGILSFGGAYSNHLVALAALCKRTGLLSVGVIRGEKPAVYSASLSDAEESGMKLHFVSREEYRYRSRLADQLLEVYPDFLLVPEGGQSAEGVRGAADILSLAEISTYTHIVCAVGTGTTIAGILSSALPHQQVIGFPALKIQQQDKNDITAFITEHSTNNAFVLAYDYHFGGYAKYSSALLHFMNELWATYGLPTDFVYTAKMFYGLTDMISQNHFAPGSRILVIHSGGLQGNRSIKNKLLF